VGAIMFFHPDVTIKQDLTLSQNVTEQSQIIANQARPEEKSTKTTIPFVKNNEFDYADLVSWIDEDYTKYAWIVFIPIVIFIVTAVSNGANLTDGIDGLAAGSSAIIVFALAIFAFVSGNLVFSDYLNVMFIPRLGEVVVFTAAFIGALIGFLWYNTYPAQVFMGDTGSLTIGGVIAVIAIAVRKELLIPLLCGIFFAESLSVILQVSWFKHTKRKYGEGRRIFKMSPVHHHFQKTGYHESKIVTRFWIVGIFLAILSIVTLKLR
ncbi:MAG: phospho-N-acetylmuramoyl-pentapeptide-transferase, partial [Flavobacteriaceae bacterium]